MKTGNSILAVFFFYMSFRIPVEINTLSLAYDIPDEVFYKFLSLVLFGVCIMLGCVSLEYGRESRIKVVKDMKHPKKEILELPVSLKNSMSDKENHNVPEVDKNLPIIKAISKKDDFTEVSNNINNVIGVKNR